MSPSFSCSHPSAVWFNDPVGPRALAVPVAGWRAAQRAVRRTSSNGATRPLCAALNARHATTERKVRAASPSHSVFWASSASSVTWSVSRFTQNAQLVAHSQLVMSNIDALVTTTFETESGTARLRAHRRGTICRRIHPRHGSRRSQPVQQSVQATPCEYESAGATRARRAELAEAIVRARMKHSPSSATELRRQRRHGSRP